MATTTRLFTADELLQMPDDGYRYELVQGELVRMTPAGYRHGAVTSNIHTSLDLHVRKRGLGRVVAAETGFKLSSNPDTVRAPDVAFLGQSRIDQVGEVEGYWPGAPDLVVEVVSPGDTHVEVEDKIFEWLAAGVRKVIAVNPRRRTVTVCDSLSEITVLTEADVLRGGEVVPGWELPVREIFL